MIDFFSPPFKAYANVKALNVREKKVCVIKPHDSNENFPLPLLQVCFGNGTWSIPAISLLHAWVQKLPDFFFISLQHFKVI